MKDKVTTGKQLKTKHADPKKKKRGTGYDKGKKKHTSTTGMSDKRDVYNPVSVEEFENIKLENERLKELNITMQKENNKVISLARNGRIDGFDESFKTTVTAVAKRVIYPICPYMSNPAQLEKCMLIMAAELQLPESKKKWFCVGYKHTVNSAISSRRNADIQLIRRQLLGNTDSNAWLTETL